MKKLLLLLFTVLMATSAMMAQRMVNGTVTDDSGSTLIGASVVVKDNPSVGTITDLDGKFKLKVDANAKALLVSYIGYTPMEVGIGASDVIDVTLSSGVQLEDVVVTALGIKKEKKSLGYSAQEVNGDELTETRNNSFVDAISGKIAGVSINTNGTPGGSSSVVIRGFTSATGSNEALYVIDGIPMLNGSNTSLTNVLNANDDFNRSQDFGTQGNDVNPDDIESMTVLKGAAATALYGSAAANGAIIITTKSGKRNQGLKVDYTGSISQSQVNRLPHLQNTFGGGWNGLWASNENGSWGPKADGKDRLWGNTVNNSRQLKPYTIQEDNLRDFYDYGHGINNSISITGGGEQSSFRLSYSNSQEDGVVPTDADSYNRNTVGLKGEIGNDKFKVTASVDYTNKGQKSVATGQGDDAGAGSVIFQEIIQIPRDHSIVDYEDYNYDFNNLDNFYTPYAQNPYFTLNEQGNKFKEDRVRGSLNFNYEFIKNLNASFRVGGDFSNSNLRDWGNKATITPGSPNSSANDVVGKYSQLSTNRSLINTDLTLNYSYPLTSSINMSALVGLNTWERKYAFNSAYITDLTIPGFYSLSNSTEDPRANDYQSLRRRLGAYGVLNFDYENWLYLTVQGRNDWSSTLPTGANTFFYPAVTLSAVLSDMMDLDKNVFSFLKLRASYAKAGNDAPLYQIYPVFNASQASGGFATTSFPIAGVSAFEKGDRIGNPELKPEISSEWEVGGEFKFFQNRVGLDLTYYDKVSDNQIVSKELDPSSGFLTQTVNIGEITNKGFEALVNLVPIKTNDFEWSLNYSFAKNNNEVVSIGEAREDGEANSLISNTAYGVELRIEEGKPIGAIYAPSAKLDDDGNIVVNPANGLPLTADDKKYLGTINHDYTMGFGTSLTYKAFTLNTNFDYRKGGLFYSYTARLNYFVGNAWNSQYNDREPFIVPGSVNELEDGTFVPNSTQVNRSDVFTYWGATDAAQENHVLDRTFLKMRNLSLTYNISPSLLSKIGVSNGSLTAFGRNLFIWTPSNNHYVDPELTTFGVGLAAQLGEFSAMPTSAVYGFTLRLSI